MVRACSCEKVGCGLAPLWDSSVCIQARQTRTLFLFGVHRGSPERASAPPLRAPRSRPAAESEPAPARRRSRGAAGGPVRVERLRVERNRAEPARAGRRAPRRGAPRGDARPRPHVLQPRLPAASPARAPSRRRAGRPRPGPPPARDPARSARRVDRRADGAVTVRARSAPPRLRRRGLRRGLLSPCRGRCDRCPSWAAAPPAR